MRSSASRIVRSASARIRLRSAGALGSISTSMAQRASSSVSMLRMVVCGLRKSCDRKPSHWSCCSRRRYSSVNSCSTANQPSAPLGCAMSTVTMSSRNTLPAGVIITAPLSVSVGCVMSGRVIQPPPSGTECPAMTDSSFRPTSAASEPNALVPRPNSDLAAWLARTMSPSTRHTSTATSRRATVFRSSPSSVRKRTMMLSSASARRSNAVGASALRISPAAINSSDSADARSTCRSRCSK